MPTTKKQRKSSEAKPKSKCLPVLYFHEEEVARPYPPCELSTLHEDDIDDGDTVVVYKLLGKGTMKRSFVVCVDGQPHS
ncbi:hypothetical protein LCGC14_2018330 [marine sediment metagenome]|uniref:Uncharacterized protein n=1 Tax=marine sediment metagenome TaxID=412755 RepID=A0A0F9FKR8_9ZZZZ